MKNIFRKIFLAALMLLSFNTFYGQSIQILSINHWLDTAHCDIVDSSMSVTVLNLDSNFTFTGNISVYFKRDTSGSSIDSLVDYVFASIPASGTDTIPIHPFNFTSNALVAGHDVVIVWPIVDGVAQSDSIKDSVFIICTAGIPTIPNNKAISLFPNPANDVLFFDSKYSINDFEYVRILDLIGEEQSRFIPNENSITIKNLAAGMYFIEVRLKDGTVITEKFIRE